MSTPQQPPPPTPPSGPLGGHRGFRLGSLFGVEIRVDWSLLIIFALITFNLGAGVFPQWHPEWSFAVVWGVALGAAILFFGSVLAHELSHAVVARTQGIEVRRITLFLFGGLAHMENQPAKPKAEFLMAVVGPITSIVIGVSAIALGSLLGGSPAQWLEIDPQTAMSNLGPGATLLLWLGPINVFLGLFNLVPGFPLDGGRVLRSILWWSTGDMVKATRLASTAGQVFAWVLMGVGALDLFGGNFVGGLWLVLIGWFLNNAARASFQQVLIRRTLEHVPVARMMSTNVEGVPPDLSVDAFVREHLLGGDQQAFPVIQNGQFIGLIGFEDVRSVPHEAWPTTAVGTVMTPSDRVFTLLPQAGAEEALDDLARLDVDQIPVVDHGNVMGFVRRRDLVRWIALQGAA